MFQVGRLAVLYGLECRETLLLGFLCSQLTDNLKALWYHLEKAKRSSSACHVS
jgi:hypothetical protein